MIKIGICVIMQKALATKNKERQNDDIVYECKK